MTECYNCDMLRARIELLEAENRRLRRKIQKLQQVIKRLEEMFRQILRMCRDIMFRMNQDYLSEKSGVPRGTWAWARGMYQAAHAIGQLAGKAWVLAKLHLN